MHQTTERDSADRGVVRDLAPVVAVDVSQGPISAGVWSPVGDDEGLLIGNRRVRTPTGGF